MKVVCYEISWRFLSSLPPPRARVTPPYILYGKLLRPRGGRPNVLTDDSFSFLLDMITDTNANPLVVRPIVLMLAEIANTPSQVGFVFCWYSLVWF